MNQITVLADFCIHFLAVLDKSMLVRVTLIDAFANKDDKILGILKERYKIIGSEDEEALIKEASDYILNVRTDICKRFQSCDPEQLRSMLNNQEFADEFLSKYIKTEEDYKNDKFLQCN